MKTFGRAGIVNPQKARTQAMELLAAVRAGEDPAQALRDERGAPTVADLCHRFMREHVKDHCKPSTAAEYRRSVELFIKPRIGTRKVGSIDRSDVTDLHHSMKDTPYQANRTLGVLSKMFNLAEVWGLRPDGSNPCRHVKKFKETKRKRYLSEAELRALGGALDDHEPEFPSAVAALRLLILTGRRLVEGQGGAQYLRKLLGLGVDWSRPSIKTSRPTSPEGRQSFVFRHATVSKRYASGKSDKTLPAPGPARARHGQRLSACLFFYSTAWRRQGAIEAGAVQRTEKRPLDTNYPLPCTN